MKFHNSPRMLFYPDSQTIQNLPLLLLILWNLFLLEQGQQWLSVAFPCSETWQSLVLGGSWPQGGGCWFTKTWNPLLATTPVREIAPLPLEVSGKLDFLSTILSLNELFYSLALLSTSQFFPTSISSVPRCTFFHVLTFLKCLENRQHFSLTFPKVRTHPTVDGVLFGLIEHDITLIYCMVMLDYTFNNSNELVMMYVALTSESQHFMLNICVISYYSSCIHFGYLKYCYVFIIIKIVYICWTHMHLTMF